MNRYADQFREPNAGATYDSELYGAGMFDAHVGALQATWLRQLVRRRFEQRPPVQLDFACGTGRMIAALEGVVAEVHGYDSSASMLQQARRNGVTATLHEVAPAGPLPLCPEPRGRPILVTVFRLLLNADDATRNRALEFACSALRSAPDGLLVFNNHGNRTSLRELARLRRLRRGPWFNSLSDRDVGGLLRRHGLRLVECLGFGLLPPTAYRHGMGYLARFVNTTAARARVFGGVSIDVVYVARLADRL